MKNKLTWLLLSLSLAALQAAPVNFSPVNGVVSADGPGEPITLFRRGSTYVALTIPADWKVAGSAAEASFTHSTLLQATARLRPYAGKINFADPKKSADAMRTLAISSAPAGATDIVAAEPGGPSVSVDNAPALEAQITFKFYGNVVRRSVLIFEDKEGAQYSLITTALESDFEAVHQQIASTLGSWWNVAGPDLKIVQVLQ